MLGKCWNSNSKKKYGAFLVDSGMKKIRTDPYITPQTPNQSGAKKLRFLSFFVRVWKYPAWVKSIFSIEAIAVLGRRGQDSTCALALLLEFCLQYIICTMLYYLVLDITRIFFTTVGWNSELFTLYLLDL